MRKLNIGVIIVFVVFSLIGCTNTTETSTQSGTTKGVEYELVENLPEGIESTIRSIKEYRGYKIIGSQGDEKYIYIGLGQKPTGGYRIAIENVEKEGNQIKISILEYKPKTDDMVTQALTYPYKVIKIEEEIDELKVFTTDGEELESIDEMGEKY